MANLLFGPLPITHEYLLQQYSSTPQLVIISSVKKIREEWESLPSSPIVLTPQTPHLATFLTPEKCSTLLIEQAQNFRDIKVHDILASHPNVIYTHAHLFKQLEPDEMKTLFSRVLVAKTRYFKTIASVFNIPLTYNESQMSNTVQTFSNSGEFIYTTTSTNQTPPLIPPPDTTMTTTTTSCPSSPRKVEGEPNKSMTLFVTLPSEHKDALITLTKRFSKNVFTKGIRVKFHCPSTNTYSIEVLHEAEHGGIVIMWLHHLSTTMSTNFPTASQLTIKL
jgi:hypothetical protein